MERRKREGGGREARGREIDFLGYAFSRDNMRLRKSIKKKFAAGMIRVKSRRRKKEIEDSYRGWCMYGRCRHLWKTITGKDMGFADKGIKTVRGKLKDGKKFFDVRQVQLSDIVNVELSVLDYQGNIDTTDIKDHSKKNNDRYVVLVELKNSGEKVKFITNSHSIKDVLDQCGELEQQGKEVFPVAGVAIKRKDLGSGRTSYQFIDL